MKTKIITIHNLINPIEDYALVVRNISYSLHQITFEVESKTYNHEYINSWQCSLEKRDVDFGDLYEVFGSFPNSYSDENSEGWVTITLMFDRMNEALAKHLKPFIDEQDKEDQKIREQFLKEPNYERKYHGMVCWCCFLMLMVGVLFFLLANKIGSRDEVVRQVNSALEELYIIPKHHIKDEPRLEEWAWNHRMKVMLKEKK